MKLAVSVAAIAILLAAPVLAAQGATVTNFARLTGPPGPGDVIVSVGVVSETGRLVVMDGAVIAHVEAPTVCGPTVLEGAG